MTRTVHELEGIETAIAESEERYRALLAQAAAEKRTRDALIVRAVDEANLTQVRVAAAAGLSRAQVIRVLAESSASAVTGAESGDETG